MSSHNSAAPLGDCQSRSDSDRDLESRCGSTRVCGRGPGPAAPVTGAGCRRRSCPRVTAAGPGRSDFESVWHGASPVTASLSCTHWGSKYKLPRQVAVAALSRLAVPAASTTWDSLTVDHDVDLQSSHQWPENLTDLPSRHFKTGSPAARRRYWVSPRWQAVGICKLCHDLHRARCFRWLHKRLQLQRRERNL